MEPANGLTIAFGLVPIFIVLMFVVVGGIILSSLIRAGVEWANNTAQPQLSEPARVVAKRVQHSTTGDGQGAVSHFTTYFATFQFPSGERRDFRLKGRYFGRLVEGDQGLLTFQGTWFRGFQRTTG